MAKAARELFLQSQLGEQRLEHDQSGIRGEFLVFEFEDRKRVGFTMDGGFARLHANGLLWFFVWCGADNSTKRKAVFLCVMLMFCRFFLLFLDVTIGEFQRQGLGVWLSL